MTTPEIPSVVVEDALPKRGRIRESMFLLATLRYDGEAKPVTARVRNISAGGMMVDSSLARTKGHRVTAALKNIGDVEGYVAWSTATRIGIAFDREIDPKLARQSVAAAPATPNFAPRVVGRRPGLAIR